MSIVALNDIPEIRRLVAGAFALRASAVQNEQDEWEARVNRRKFVYFVDPNTVIWFCRPHERHNLSGFDPAVRDVTDEASPDFPIAFATLDYMFVRDLPGAEKSPLYISRAHEEEFFANDRLELRSKRPRADKGEVSIIDAVKALREREDIPDNIDDLYGAMRKALANPILSATFAKQRYGEMADRRLVRRANYDYYLPPQPRLTWESLSARHRLAKAAWFERLVKHRQDADHSVNLERDAETLADLELLNAVSDSRSFVIITVDKAIHLAMADWVSEKDPDDRRAFSRHPRQYMPLLNLNSAATIRLDVEFFQQIKNAATALAEAADVVVSRPPVGPEAHVFTHDLADNARGQSWQQLAPQAARLRHEWQKAMQTATALLIKSLEESTLKPLASVMAMLREQLNDEAVAEVLVQVIEQQSERIVRSNRAFAINGRLLALTTSRDAHAAPRLPNLLRVPPVDEVDRFMWRHGADPADLFEDFLGDVLKGPDVQRAQIIEDFEQLLVSLPDTEAYSFATYIAYRMRDWRSVRYFAQNFENAARELNSKDPKAASAKAYLSEARYARHVADRFLLETPDEIRRLRSLLLRDCTRADIDLFVRARTASELAALTLVMILRGKIGQFTVLDSNLRELLSDAERWIRHGLRWNNAPEADGREGRHALLNVQLRVNLAAAYLFRAVMFKERDAVVADPGAWAALDALSQLNEHPATHAMARLYQYGLAVALGQRDQTRALNNLQQALHEYGQSGTFRDPIDQRVREWFIAFERSERPQA